MKFVEKEKAQLLDFIICHEIINNNREDEDFSSLFGDDTLSHTIVKNYYDSIKDYHSLIANLFSSPYFSIVQLLFRAINKNENIDNADDFIKKINDLSPVEIKKIIIYFLSSGKDSVGGYDVEHYIDDFELFFDLVDSKIPDTASKYIFLNAYKKPKQLIAKINILFDEVFPLFLKFYKQLESYNADKIKKIYELSYEDIYAICTNFFGSEKLNELFKNFNKDIFTLDNIKKFEIAPLLFGYNRTVLIGSHNDGFFKTNFKICCIGLALLKTGHILEKANDSRKNLLKALSDDTRFDILRMISYGFNTNKKLSDFFQISRPAITYQTTKLKDANLITSKNGLLKVNINVINDGFDDIKNLLNIHGDTDYLD